MAGRQTKSTQDRHERMLLELIKQPGNNLCVDCRAKNPRWASHNLGVFLCIRCGGLHRKMGTHISKVKSVSMDSWTPDQIESIRASGGNDAVNRKYNPHPEKHPLPLADDDHGMERYIRNKWEKKTFMDSPVAAAPPPPISKSPTGAAIPQRSSSVPRVLHGTDLSRSLATLRDMGFRDEEKNRRVLTQTNGSLESAIEILSKLPGQSTGIPQNDQMNDNQKLAKLWSLGYKDENMCRDALRRTGGNLEVAIDLLSKGAKAAATSTNSGNGNVLSQQKSAGSLIDVSDNNYTPQPTNMNPYQVQQQQQPMQQSMQMPMQMQQQAAAQQIPVQQVMNPFGNFIGTAQPNTMIQTPSAANQSPFSFGMNGGQPQVQPQMTGFNQQIMGQYQQPPMQPQQSSFASNPFSQLVSSASTPTNSFGVVTPGAVNPFSSQPVTAGNAYGFPQQSPMGNPHNLPTRSYTSPDFSQNSNVFSGRSNSATEFHSGSGQNPFF
ncbi:hypothetical protein NQZ79_g5663 [Umbelopsis isabellina]|nr:hypothetical protein NQZ79_g5663 [Umbelopsis isabellina]